MHCREWKSFVQEQGTSESCGCLMIQADDLQHELINFIDNYMETLRTMLVNSARKESMQILNKMNNLIR